MREMFSTDGIRVRDRFRLWREFSGDLLPPFRMSPIGDGPFAATWWGAELGDLGLSRTAFGPHDTETNSSSVRRNAKQDNLVAAFRAAGIARHRQYERAARAGPGDLTIFDNNAPLDLEFPAPTRTLRVELPRGRLERMLGPARLYAGLHVDGDLPGTRLARTFFAELARTHERMPPDTAERMAGVGADLLVAALAERMARETPRPLQATLTVQRAKAYVEANLGDPDLDPPRLAAAVGVSLRRLQELFHARGRHISDWIWERRLEVAAQRLADPGHAHLGIGALAYGCGFANQAHFAKRFRARFGVSPREHRRAALMPEG